MFVKNIDKRKGLVGVIAVVLFGSACGEKDLTEGMTPGDCTDLADNDGDGYFDCEDDGCLRSPECQTGEDTSTPVEDADGDGVTEADGDCNDADATINPNAEDTTADGVDQNCDGVDGIDSDGDGYASMDVGGTDCDDGDGTVHPEASEDFEDGLDNDCDGYVDIEGSMCQADFEFTLPNGDVATMDGCVEWNLDPIFNFDPQDPPWLRHFTAEFNGTTAAGFDCRVTLEQNDLCEDGYFDVQSASSNLGFVTTDCFDIPTDYEAVYTASSGFIRFDSINTGIQGGTFIDQPLLTAIDAEIYGMSSQGVSISGQIRVSLTQIATNEEDSSVCSEVAETVYDADGDGVVSTYFGGDDCNDADPNLVSQSQDGDCDGVLTIDDCDDADPTTIDDMDCDGILGIEDCNDFEGTMPLQDADCDGALTIDDCNDNSSSVLSMANDADCDGVLTAEDCDDANGALLSQAMDPDCDGTLNLDLGGVDLSMVSIPPGVDPLGRYEISAGFYLMETETTQEMWLSLMSYNSFNGGGPLEPADRINWHMTADFANKVTERHNLMHGTSLQDCYICTDSDTINVDCVEASNPYQCTGYVLPTDAEWEYASRSGSPFDFWTPDGGGNGEAGCTGTEVINDGVTNPLLADYAWYCGNFDYTVTTNYYEVGQKLPNGFGLYDMHGNVIEFTADVDSSSCTLLSGTDPYCGYPVVSGSHHRVRSGFLGYAYQDVSSSWSSSWIDWDFGAGTVRLALHP